MIFDCKSTSSSFSINNHNFDLSIVFFLLANHYCNCIANDETRHNNLETTLSTFPFYRMGILAFLVFHPRFFQSVSVLFLVSVFYRYYRPESTSLMMICRQIVNFKIMYTNERIIVHYCKNEFP